MALEFFTVPTEVHVELVEADYVAFVRHHQRTSKSWRQLRASFTGLFVFAAALPFITSSLAQQPIVAAHFATLSAVALGMGLFLIQMNRAAVDRIRQWARSSRGGHWMSLTILRIDPVNVSWESTSRVTRLAWSLVADIVKTDTHIFLYLTEDSAAIVPRRCFPSETAYTDFLFTIRQYWLAAPPLDDACPQCHYNLRGIKTPGCPECGWRRENETI